MLVLAFKKQKSLVIRKAKKKPHKKLSIKLKEVISYK